MMYKLFLAATLSILLLPATAQQKKHKTVFIIVDGIAADALEQTATPNLDAIARKGHYFRAWLGGEKGTYSETPTISAVGYNSLLTGTWANKHNVWGNGIKAPNYHYPTIFQLFKQQYPQGTTGVFSTWLDNRTKLVGAGKTETGGFAVDYVADGYENDTSRFPHDKQRDFMEKIDQLVADTAASIIGQDAPDLSWVYLEYTDDMGHMYGDQEPFYRAIRLMDEKVGLIWKAIQQREKKHNEEWLIVITTDHGRSAVDGKGHGGQSYRERNTWIVMNQPAINAYATYYTPAITDILPTIARFMNISIPADVQRELDGQSLTGPASVTDMHVLSFQHKLDISWKPLITGEKVKVYISVTNHFKTGSQDNYTLLGTYPIEKGAATIDVSAYPSDFYKVVLEAPGTTLNRWVVEKEMVK